MARIDFSNATIRPTTAEFYGKTTSGGQTNSSSLEGMGLTGSRIIAEFKNHSYETQGTTSYIHTGGNLAQSISKVNVTNTGYSLVIDGTIPSSFEGSDENCELGIIDYYNTGRGFGGWIISGINYKPGDTFCFQINFNFNFS